MSRGDEVKEGRGERSDKQLERCKLVRRQIEGSGEGSAVKKRNM